MLNKERVHCIQMEKEQLEIEFNQKLQHLKETQNTDAEKLKT